MSQAHGPEATAGVPQSSTQTLIVTEQCPAAMRKRAFWSIEQFHILKKLGAGYASTVYLGTCRQTGNQVAVKMYHKQKLSELNYFQISREIRIHSQLDHQNIVQLWSAFEDIHGVYLISEFCAKGDVFSDVERRGGSLSETETVRQIIYPFLCALQYLHGNNIIHRDIKPENLLLTAAGVLKVADFGLSINTAEERPVTRVGTLDYMSPEVVICPDKSKPNDNKEMKHLYYTALVDAWAVGVLAYELVVGRPPFDRGNKKATVQEILNGEPAIPPSVSEQARHFIQWSLTKDQRRRPGISDMIEHPWVVEHMAQPATRQRGLTRADSFVDSRGFMRAAGADARESQVEDMVRNMQAQAVQQTGRMLQSSLSMTAVDTMRFRDVRLELLRAEAAKSRAGSSSGAASQQQPPQPQQPHAPPAPAPGPGSQEAQLLRATGSAQPSHSMNSPIGKAIVSFASTEPHSARSSGATDSKDGTKRGGAKKNVSFHAKSLPLGPPVVQTSPQAPTDPPNQSPLRSPLTRSRTFTNPETSRSRSFTAGSPGSPSRAGPTLSSSGAPPQLITVGSSGNGGNTSPTSSKPLARALSQVVPARNAMTPQEMQAELLRARAANEAGSGGLPSPRSAPLGSGSGAFPTDPAGAHLAGGLPGQLSGRISSGTPLAPSRLAPHGSMSGVNNGSISNASQHTINSSLSGSIPAGGQTLYSYSSQTSPVFDMAQRSKSQTALQRPPGQELVDQLYRNVQANIANATAAKVAAAAQQQQQQQGTLNGPSDMEVDEQADLVKSAKGLMRKVGGLFG